jgi:hypothetical protein
VTPGGSTEHEMGGAKHVVFWIVLLVADAVLTFVEAVARVGSRLRSKS